MLRSSLLMCVAGLTFAEPPAEASPQSNSVASQIAPASTNRQIYEVKGTVIEVLPQDKAVRIRHEEIPGYMPAMTMPFDVKDTNELAGLEVGDSVSFRMIVTSSQGWIDHIRKRGVVERNNLPTTGPFRFVRDVEPLNIGDLLPAYTFTNQLGHIVSTTQFKGQALAITFLFTRCPFPNFCPLMANNFEAVQKQLLAVRTGPPNWHLLTISFDPEHDAPAVLKAYAESHHYDPAHWDFLTGNLVDITAITEQFGLAFWHDETGSISHNLRTVVVDARGRVQKVFAGNKWTSDELVAEMVKAAANR